MERKKEYSLIASTSRQIRNNKEKGEPNLISWQNEELIALMCAFRYVHCITSIDFSGFVKHKLRNSEVKFYFESSLFNSLHKSKQKSK